MTETVTLSTRDLNYAQKLSFWRDYVCQTFVDLNCENAAKDSFEGEITSRDAGDMRYSNVWSRPQRVVRDKSRISRSNDDCFLVSMQLTGQGHVIQAGRTATLNPGEFALYDVTRPYSLIFEGDYQQLVLTLPRKTLLERFSEAESTTAVAVSGSHSATQLATTLFTQISTHLPQLDSFTVQKLQSDAVDLLVDALRMQTAATLPQQGQSQTLLTQRILRFIDANLGDTELRPETIAAAHGISERYLRKLFESRTLGVADYIWRRRLEHARLDLCNPNKAHISLASIAFDWAFKDPSHFSRAFKSAFGLSPREARRQAMH
ncbi:MAG: helix-turn-helix domain-containing protein [Sphingomonadales bacterium]